MEKIFKIAVIALSVVLPACAAKQTAKDILKDDNMRDQVMAAICNDTAMAAQMISRLYATESSQKMLPLTCTILSHIQTSEDMQKDTSVQNLMVNGTLHLMSHDSALCDKTCTKMNMNEKIAKVMQNKKAAVPERVIVKSK